MQREERHIACGFVCDAYTKQRYKVSHVDFFCFRQYIMSVNVHQVLIRFKSTSCLLRITFIIALYARRMHNNVEYSKV